MIPALPATQPESQNNDEEKLTQEQINNSIQQAIIESLPDVRQCVGEAMKNALSSL